MINLSINLKNKEKLDFSIAPEFIKADGQVFDAPYIATKDGENIRICASGEIKDDMTLIAVDGGFICQRTIKNLTDNSVNVKEICVKISGINFGGDEKDDYFYCNENPRLYGVYTLPIDFDRLSDNPDNEKFGITVDKRWVDPGAINERILYSPYQPFPAIHIGNYACQTGLIHGSLSQDVFYHNYKIYRQGGGITLTAYSSFKSIAYRVLKAGEELTDKWYLGVTQSAGDLNCLFDGYSAQLRKYLLKTRAKNSTNKDGVVWGSWNDGIYRDVSEKLLIDEAKAIKENFAAARWIQLDDGYSAYCEKDPDEDAHGIGVVYEGDDGIDKIKFPSGLKGYTEKIKQVGLLPSIWIGGFCPHKTKIYKERPDWFVDYNYRVPTSSPLDVSKSEVREYMVSAMQELLVNCGFEGIKHDFWSYAFEDGKDLLSNKEKSGYEHRKWWLGEIRKRLPEHGYMQTGCDLCMGNPFLGEFFDNYRFGLDVGSGNWNNVKTTLFWGCACFSTHTGDMFIPNGDSIGLMNGLNDADFYFLLNYLLITHSLVEISGLYSKTPINQNRLNVLKKATRGLNNGANVYFANFDYRKKGAYIPNIMYSKEKCFSDADFSGEILCTIALFNPEESEKTISFSAKDVGFDGENYLFYEVWTGEKARGEKISATLKPHQSILYYLSK